MHKGRVLAIDYGSKRVGTALSDPMRVIASPLAVLPNDKTLLPALIKIIADQEVTAVVIGKPVKEDGGEAGLAAEIALFSSKLRLSSGIAVELLDERYTSVIAEARIRGGGLKKSRREQKGLIDIQAATVLLEDFLRMLNR